jgi:hypothetical protein
VAEISAAVFHRQDRKCSRCSLLTHTHIALTFENRISGTGSEKGGMTGRIVYSFNCKNIKAVDAVLKEYETD